MIGVLFLVIGGVVGGLVILVIYKSESKWIVCSAIFIAKVHARKSLFTFHTLEYIYFHRLVHVSSITIAHIYRVVAVLHSDQIYFDVILDTSVHFRPPLHSSISAYTASEEYCRMLVLDM